MATHSSILAWKTPWTEEPGGLQSMGLQRVRHDWPTEHAHNACIYNMYISYVQIGEGNGNPLQCSCLENPRDGGAWWAAVYGVAQSRTWLKWLNLNLMYKYIFRSNIWSNIESHYSAPSFPRWIVSESRGQPDVQGWSTASFPRKGLAWTWPGS